MSLGRMAFAMVAVLAQPAYAVAQEAPTTTATTHVVVPYQGGPVPPGATLTHRVSHAMLGGGLAAFLFGYIVSVVIAENTIECAPPPTPMMPEPAYNADCLSQVPATQGASPATSMSPGTVAPSEWLLVPFIGPWAALSDPYTRDRLGAEAIAAGMLQGVGVAAVIVALISRDAYLESDEPVQTSRRRNTVEWSLIPASAVGPGASVVGRF